MSERVGFIEHKGKLILSVDFSSLDRDEDKIFVIRNTQRVVQAQPLKSVLILAHLADVHFDTDVVRHFIEVIKSDVPFVAATAIVGGTKLQNAVIKAISTIARRELVTFDSREEALDWLVQR